MKRGNIVFRFRTRLFEMKSAIVVALLISINVQIQGQIRFGLKGGMNMSKFDMTATEGVVIDFSSRFAFHAGGVVEIPLNGFFSLQPEMLFSSKGARCRITETYILPIVTGYREITHMMKLTYAPGYIELPIY